MSDVTVEIDEMIRLRATRAPSVNQMQVWKSEIERLRGALLRCRGMVGHPDNIAFIDAALGVNQQKISEAE